MEKGFEINSCFWRGRCFNELIYESIMSNLFIISSVIYPKHKPLSYSDIRSSFSEKERYKQTIDTVRSAQQHIKDVDIFRLEAWLKDIYNDELKSLWITYKYLWNNKIVRYFVDWKFKWAWESILLLFWTLWLNLSQYDFVYKISGRYTLNNQFDPNLVQKRNKFSFLLLKNHYSTRLYCFDKWLYYIRKLYLCLFVVFGLLNLSIELLWYYLLPKYLVHQVKTLWVQGNIWVNWDLIKE